MTGIKDQIIKTTKDHKPTLNAFKYLKKLISHLKNLIETINFIHLKAC